MPAALPRVAAALLLAFAAAAAADRPASPVVEDAWIRALPGDLPAAGYFTLRNGAAQARRLTAAESPAFGMVMLHRSTEKNGQSQMTHVEAVAVPAKGRLRFAPGGYHLMLMDAAQPLAVGASVPVTLHFDDGSAVTVPFAVRGADAAGP